MKDRSQGIGSSEIAAICGLNKWRKPIDVYMSKLGLVEDTPDNDNMWWGREMEPILIKKYEQVTGNAVTVLHSDDMPCRHKKYPWFMYSPDGLLLDDPTYPGVVECKTTGASYRDEWGEPGTDEIPQEYLIQCQWLMEGAGAQWADVPVLFMGSRREFQIYRVNRDQELIDSLISKAADFWNNHIIPQIPPPVDNAPGWDTYFKSTMPQEESPVYMADAGTEYDILTYRDICADFKKAESRKQYWENQIKSYIGNHAGIRGSFGKITWKKSKDRTVTDWQQAYMDLCSYCHDKNLVINDEDFSGKHTTIKPGPRILRATWKKED